MIGSMAHRSNFERLRGFCDRPTDRRTFPILEPKGLKVAKEDQRSIGSIVDRLDGR